MDETKKRIQVKVDKDVAEKATSILDSLGLTTTSAVNLLFRRIVATKSFPVSLDLTQGEKAMLDFKENTQDVPRHVFNDEQEVKDWIKDDEY